MVFTLPALILLDGITTFIGINKYDIPEGNPLLLSIAGTPTHIFLCVMLAILFFRMMLMDYVLQTIKKPSVKITYKTLIVIYALFQASNIYGIIRTATYKN